MEAQEKECVSMLIFVDPTGKQTPMSFVTSEGRKIKINHCRGSENRASRKVGGVGICYECEVGNKIIYFLTKRGVGLLRHNWKLYLETTINLSTIADF